MTRRKSAKKSRPSHANDEQPKRKFGGAQPGAGRPRKATPEVLDAICTMLEKARHFDHACWHSGISPKTVEDLMTRDEEVRERIQLAKAKGEEELLATLGDCIESGKATGGAQWLAERLYPKRYHLPKQLEVSGRDGGPQQVEATITVDLTTAKRIARGEE